MKELKETPAKVHHARNLEYKAKLQARAWLVQEPGADAPGRGQTRPLQSQEMQVMVQFVSLKMRSPF